MKNKTTWIDVICGIMGDMVRGLGKERERQRERERELARCREGDIFIISKFDCHMERRVTESYIILNPIFK